MPRVRARRYHIILHDDDMMLYDDMAPPDYAAPAVAFDMSPPLYVTMMLACLISDAIFAAAILLLALRHVCLITAHISIRCCRCC